jgi:hypothetical protein
MTNKHIRNDIEEIPVLKRRLKIKHKQQILASKP